MSIDAYTILLFSYQIRKPGFLRSAHASRPPLMLASYVLRRTPRALCVRSYASKVTADAPKIVQEQVTTRAPSTGGECEHF